ncbi:MAG: hypothetical protein ACYSWZ_16060 [Planctomycetota bacterium]|jgi:hypothetical protein
MRTKTAILCAVVLLTVPIITFAQKTEVSVKKGKVIAQTGMKSVAVEEGRKAVLLPDRNPVVAVDDPMVDDVMEISKWIEAEKQAQRQIIERSGIQILRIDDERLIKLAWLSEGTNSGAQPMKEIKRGPTLILKDPEYYDMEGNLIPFDLEKINARSGIYTMHLSKAIGPGEQIKYIGVSEIDNAVFLKDGPLWILQMNYGSGAHGLYYYRFILPESAIFVDSSQPAAMIDSVDGRVAVTIRVYTGSGGIGVTIAYLWPDKDGTTVADIPPQYRGLRDQTEEEVVEEGRLETAKILSGGTYEKQNTPLEALLSLYSAAVHKSPDDFLNLITPDLREDAASEMEQIMGLASRVVDYEFLGTPEWPDVPENGYKHPVYLCSKGSLICEATLVMVYQDGKWYLEGLEIGRKKMESTDSSESADSKVSGGVTITKGKTDLSAATYEGLKPGKFMRRWLFLGLIQIPWEGETYFPDNEHSNKFFDTESLNLEQFKPRVRIGEKDYQWDTLRAEYGVVDLTQVYDDWFVVAYAWAQVNMAEETKGVLGIGSDDSVKIWLNGKLVHKNLVTRGVIADNDRVPVTFKKGKNQLVLKILNTGGPWGFACRLLEK